MLKHLFTTKQFLLLILYRTLKYIAFKEITSNYNKLINRKLRRLKSLYQHF